MPLYEHVYMARQDVSAQQVEAMTDAFKGILEANGGKVVMVENWGLRSLAYKIKKNRKAHYVRLNIEGPHSAVAEMERQQSLNEDVLRILTLRVDEHDAEPAGILTNRGERDRGPRGGFGGRDDRGPRRDRDDRGPKRDFNRDDKPRDDKPSTTPADAPAASAE